jgi:hypothetical protein
VSKVTGHNFIRIATEAMLGIDNDQTYKTLEYDHVGVKNPQFSYNRLKGADPVAGVEMASTGEVACFGSNIQEAFYLSWLSTEQKIQGKTLFLSLPDEHKHKFVEEAAALIAGGWKIYCTTGTHKYMKDHGIKTTLLYKISEKKQPSIESALHKHKISLMINVPATGNDNNDGYIIRRLAIDSHIPLMTNAETGRLLLRCLTDPALAVREPTAWRDYVEAAA